MGLQLFSVTKNSCLSRFFDRTNMSPDRLWDILNCYIDKENNIQQRNGVAKYNAAVLASNFGEFTISIASPAVITQTAHGLAVGDSFYMTTTGELPTGVTASTTYYVTNLSSANAFYFSATKGGTQVNTSGSQSGTHTLYAYPKILYLTEIKIGAGLKRMVCRSGAGWFKEDGDAIWDSLDGSRTHNVQGDAVMCQDGASADSLVMVDGGKARIVSIGSDGTFGTVYNLGEDPYPVGVPPQAPDAVHLHNGHLVMNDKTAGKESLVYVSAFRRMHEFNVSFDSLILDLRYVLPQVDTPIGFYSVGDDTLVIICKSYIATYYAPEDTLQWYLKKIYHVGGLTNYATMVHPIAETLFIPGLEDINGFTMEGQVLVKEANPFLEIVPLYRDYLTTLTSSNWKYINGGICRKLNHYYIGFPLSAGHEILVFSLDRNAIVGRYTGLTMWSFCEREDGTIIIGGDGGQAYTFNSGTSDDGVAITSRVSTPYYYADNNERFKAIKGLRVPVSHTANLTLYADWTWDTQAGSTVNQALAANSLGRSDFKTKNITGRGRGIAFDIYHSTKDAIISISQWAVYFILQGIK